MKIRLFFFFSLQAVLIVLICILSAGKEQLVFPRTLSPFLEQLGKPVQSVNRSISKLMPIRDIDEALLGQEIKAIYEQIEMMNPSQEQKKRYLNDLIRDLTDRSQKGFDYTVFLLQGPPNAYALPGGVICVTEALLDLMSSEAELAAILGHEIGHIERGHLFDRCRQIMLSRKIKKKKRPIEEYASDAIQSLVGILFNKTEESEADEYGFQLLLAKGYDPFGMAGALRKLLELTSEQVNLYHDFFSSHPYTALREAKFQYLANRWQKEHPDSLVYSGEKNLKEYRSRSHISYEEDYRRIPKKN